MTKVLKLALDVALTLPEAERIRLAEILIARIAETSGPEIDEAWSSEAKRRDQAVNVGVEKLLDGDEILGRLARGERP